MQTIAPLLHHLRHTPLKGPLAALKAREADALTEVRVRVDRPVLAHVGGRIGWLCADGFHEGAPMPDGRGVRLNAAECGRLLEALCEQSLYAREEELRAGYLTLPGGFRVGVCGQMSVVGGRVTALRHATSFNIRVARAVPGCADRVMPHLLQHGRACSALVLSPPGEGKTTLLRDIARQMGAVLRVCVVDERGEIAGCYEGVPRLDVGLMTDVLDGCPKGEGLPLLLRSMRPDVVIADEIGCPADAAALQDASACGVAVIASAHAACYEDAIARPALCQAIMAGGFTRIITLGAPQGTIRRVQDGKGRALA